MHGGDSGANFAIIHRELGADSDSDSELELGADSDSELELGV